MKSTILAVLALVALASPALAVQPAIPPNHYTGQQFQQELSNGTWFVHPGEIYTNDKTVTKAIGSVAGSNGRGLSTCGGHIGYFVPGAIICVTDSDPMRFMSGNTGSTIFGKFCNHSSRHGDFDPSVPSAPFVLTPIVTSTAAGPC